MFLLSLPMRGRGLKYFDVTVDDKLRLSLPMRGRGLKFAGNGITRVKFHVAPHAGAWIEIKSCAYVARYVTSLPMRGRGLKFRRDYDILSSLMSLPMRGRGLKYIDVAINNKLRLSLPMRGRGLKYLG